MNKATASALKMTRDQPIHIIKMDDGENSILTVSRSGNAILTKKTLKQNKRKRFTDTACCVDCGWQCKSTIRKDNDIKMRLHHKVCPNKK